MSQVHLTPLSPASVPSAAMVWWALLFSLGCLTLAVRGFERRDL
jgi:hypothetical protein